MGMAPLHYRMAAPLPWPALDPLARAEFRLPEDVYDWNPGDAHRPYKEPLEVLRRYQLLRWNAGQGARGFLPLRDALPRAGLLLLFRLGAHQGERQGQFHGQVEGAQGGVSGVAKVRQGPHPCVSRRAIDHGQSRQPPSNLWT